MSKCYNLHEHRFHGRFVSNKLYVVIQSVCFFLTMTIASHAFAVKSQPTINNKADKNEQQNQEIIKKQTNRSKYNEVGIDYDKEYISDLKEYWDYASAYYYRINNIGKFGGRVNYYKKFGLSAEQYQLEAHPRFAKQVYGDFEIAYARNYQNNFPSFQYLVQLFYDTSYGVELSLGQAGRIYSMFSNQEIYTYTASAGYYFGNYLAWVRPYYYTPKSVALYEAGITRYFSDPKNQITLRLNAGRVPDIGDLPPLDQMIVAKQLGVILYGQYGFVESLYLRLGFGYTHLVYPTVVREITSGMIGLLCIF